MNFQASGRLVIILSHRRLLHLHLNLLAHLAERRLTVADSLGRAAFVGAGVGGALGAAVECEHARR